MELERRQVQTRHFARILRYDLCPHQGSHPAVGKGHKFTVSPKEREDFWARIVWRHLGVPGRRKDRAGRFRLSSCPSRSQVFRYLTVF